jgi:aryl-alcohol dehydrogenase-like predicted oxidoreductase
MAQVFDNGSNLMNYSVLADGGRISKLSLGSWHIFSRLSFADSAALVKRALDQGITLFDVGDYWDHELSNEERFRDVIRHLGIGRDHFQVAVKVFTNSAESRKDLVQGSLRRLGLDYADFVVCSRPAPKETMAEAVERMTELIEQGLSRHLAFSLWTPELFNEAFEALRSRGGPLPQYLQLQYNVCRRSVVESENYRSLFASSGIRLQAANVLEGGILTGHLHRERFHEQDRAAGRWFSDRNIPRDSGGIRPQIRDRAAGLAAAALRMGVTPAQLAIAFCLVNPALGTVLFGATRPEQIDENIGALELASQRAEEVLAAATPLLVEGAAPPPLFDPAAGLH